MALGTTSPSPFLSLFAKEWPKVFSTSRKPNENRPCVDVLIEAVRTLGLEPDGDICQIFMESYDDDLTSIDVQNVVRFIQAIGDCNLCDQRLFRKKPTAWLDDRTFDRAQSQQQPLAPITVPGDAHAIPTACETRQVTAIAPAQLSPVPYSADIECDIVDAPIQRSEDFQNLTRSSQSRIQIRSARNYHAPLTADEIHNFLREKRFDHAVYSDADRRLIHIADPDAYDFLALMKTATEHQQRSLQEAICRYFAMDTSIKTTVPEAGYPVFHLHFHIAYFALRRSRPDQNFSDRKKRSHRGWMNITFLDVKDSALEQEGVLGIHQAQISVTICGTDNSRWIAYCFEDKSFDEEEEISDNGQSAYRHSDHIARGEFEAEDTIWDPREYYFRVLLIRMRQVQKEWGELVRLIDLGIKKHSWGRFFFSPTRNGIPPAVDDNAISTWIADTMQLLGKLLDDIAKINQTWIRFTSTTGDLAFFSDTHSNPRMVRISQQLIDVFDQMQALENRLRCIAELCEKWAQTVNLRLTSDGQRSAQLTVWFISPFAIVSTFFAIPVPIVAFNRNLVSFTVLIFLYTMVLQALLFFWGGKFWRQPWWEKLSWRAKAIWIGDPSLTTRNEDGNMVLQRRSTHSGFA